MYGIAKSASKTFPGCTYFADTDKKLVALTIDDGPDSITTRQILSILQKYKAKATFFLIGSRVLENKNVVIEIIEHGHEIGHHMFTGKTTIRMQYREFTQQFDKTDSILSQYSEVRWFRPGSGWYSDEMTEYLGTDGYNYQCVLGSVYPFDVQIPSTTFATVFILVNTRPGSIIVLHDRGDRGRRTIKVLSNIIPKLQKRGYQFVTLTELFK
jgi:peptidoglycan/xylan/chitin deacetylase (PgdA/CDA1 family)